MVLVRCNDCGYEWESNAKSPRCPKKDCKSKNVTPVEAENEGVGGQKDSNTEEIRIEENFVPEIQEVIEPVGPSVSISEDAMMKLDYVSELMNIDKTELVEKLINSIYSKITPFVVPINKIVRRGSVYEIDVDGLEDKVFLRLSIMFSELRQALIVASSFNQQGTTSVVSHDGRYWRVFYELPDPKDVFDLSQFKDVFGRKLALRFS